MNPYNSSILSQMRQTCLNLMSIAKDISNTEEIEDVDFFLDNVSLNYKLLIEFYMQIQYMYEDLVSKDTLKKTIDFVNSGLNAGNLPRILFALKNEIPMLKEKIETKLKNK